MTGSHSGARIQAILDNLHAEQSRVSSLIKANERWQESYEWVVAVHESEVVKLRASLQELTESVSQAIDDLENGKHWDAQNSLEGALERASVIIHQVSNGF